MDHNLLAPISPRFPLPILAFTGTSSLWTLPLVHWCSLHSKGSHFKLCLSQVNENNTGFMQNFTIQKGLAQASSYFIYKKSYFLNSSYRSGRRDSARPPGSLLTGVSLILSASLSGSKWQESCPRWKATCYHALAQTPCLSSIVRQWNKQLYSTKKNELYKAVNNACWQRGSQKNNSCVEPKFSM